MRIAMGMNGDKKEGGEENRFFFIEEHSLREFLLQGKERPS